MRISVVIPVLNDLRVGKAIDSALSQEHPGDHEVIVVDGGSKDGTLEALGAYEGDGRVRVLTGPDDGIFDAVNKGINCATGDIVAFLGADDRYEFTGVFRSVVETLKNPEVDFCFGDLVYVDNSERVIRRWCCGAYSPLKLHLGWSPPHPSVFIRRAIHITYGVFDTRFRVAADYELWLRLLLVHRLTAAYIPRVLVRMTLGGNSNRSIRNIIRGNTDKLRAWCQVGRPLGLAAPFLNVAWKMYHRFLALKEEAQ